MTLRLGVLGFAHGHIHAYCAQWHEAPALGVTPAVGWDHDAERLDQAARQHDLTPFDDLEALLARDDIPAVVIAAETAHHARLVERAAAAGKVIVLQKPLALTMEEADRIVDAVERHAVPFTLAWQMRVDPQNLEIKRLMETGAVGRVFMLRRRHGLATHAWPGFADLWHVKPELNRDIWADDAAHPIDFVYWLLGMPQSVTAEIMSLHDPAVPMDNGVALFRYANGPLAEVCCSFTCLAAENTTEVVGERGSIVQNYGDVPSCNVPRREGAVGLRLYTQADGRWHDSDIASPGNHGERIAGLAAPLAAFLRGERAPIATAREGRDVLAMTLACYASSETGRRVSLVGGDQPCE